MREQRQHLITLFLICFSILTLSCVDFDSYTDVGSEVVKEYDPSLINFESSFHPVLFDTNIVVKAYSLPTSASSGFGHHNQQLAAGNVEGHLLFGSIVFTISQDFVGTFNSNTVFDSISFLFDTLVDSTLATTFNSKSVLDLYLVDSENRSYLNKQDTTGKSISRLKKKSSRFYGNSTDSIFRNSIFSSCKRLLTNGTKTDSVFNLTLFNSRDNDFVWLKKNPAMILYTTEIDDDTTINADTVWGTSFYIAQESDSVIETAREETISSFLSRRTAVFRLDLSPLWDTIEHSGFDEILSASISLESDTIIANGDDTTLSLLYLFTEKKISDGKILEKNLDNDYEESFSEIDSLSTIEDGSLTITVSRHLQLKNDSKPRYMYLYLQIISSHTPKRYDISWKKPSLRTVLTTIR